MFNLVNAHQFDKSLLTSWNWLLQKVTCPQCNKSICHQSLTHQPFTWATLISLTTSS
jgi:hypothetical protein